MSLRVMSSSDLPILVASDSPRQIEAIRKAGLVAIEVEPSEVGHFRKDQPGPDRSRRQ